MYSFFSFIIIDEIFCKFYENKVKVKVKLKVKVNNILISLTSNLIIRCIPSLI